MFQVIGASPRAINPTTIGNSWSTFDAYSSANQAIGIAYGNGWFFGGRANFFTLSKDALYNSANTQAAVGYFAGAGPSVANQKPSYENGYYFCPSGANLYRGTDVNSLTSTTTGTSEVSKVLWVESLSKWVAYDRASANNGFQSTNGTTWTTMTVSGLTANKASAATNGTVVIISAGNDGGMVRSASGASAFSPLTHPFGTATIPNVRYHPEKAVWTAGYSAGLAAYTTVADGSSGWTLITHNMSLTGTYDVQFINNRWHVIGSQPGQIQISTSATDSITSAFTAKAVFTYSSTAGSLQSATDGNFLMAGAKPASVTF